ncbi:NAD(P)H-dependent oxidoreductase [Kibdelosporangium philippinense]|uniref:NAD(P)H-dependent oxidoreductase n=1 Tax=Kibdelosporangium philippinense TaxID=211113 RepID=A0ABS8ZWW9_9PSEU|nr:NAD(P)H-dependent oxidoreductase [Kibdelosporangium philippinense]MCE7011111.1 NAD(P)H-dependent oxidoreductase [Kibdelosporangium philippinense]
MSEQLRLAVVLGSTRAGRFGPTIARWFATHASHHPDMDVDVIDLLDAPDFTERIAAADAYVIVTPEYNHGYPAPLKHAIDLCYTEWHAKPVGFVSYGGLSGGVRAVEQLRQVFAELHAVTIRDSVSFAGAHAQFDRDGNPKDPSPCAIAAKGMLDQLAWWAHALRDARAVRPYGNRRL